MSTSSTSSTSSASTGYGLTSLGGSSSLQITGLSSGLDTDEIVSELMQVKEQPLNALKSQEGQLEAKDTELSTLQSELQTVANDAQALLDPSLYDTSQSVTSSNSSAVSASATSSNGAVEGGYQVDVTQLAKSAQRTFTYAPPSADDAITIDGQAVTISAGESASDFAAAVNNNANLDVYATATDSGTIVLSNRATGNMTGNYIQVTDPAGAAGALVEQPSKAYAGQDAAYTVDGVAGTSASDTVTGAIPGVTLTLGAVTTNTGAVTVNVGAPAVNASSVQSALTQFITDYNKAITDIQTQVSTPPSSTTDSSGNTVYSGTLYDDQDLNDLLSQMRSSMYQTVSGTNSGLTTMLNVGVSTGATTGTGSLSTSAIAGDLTLDASSLAGALSSDPDGVQKLLGGWANSFSSLVEESGGVGGTIDNRISSNKSQLNDLDNQISEMQTSIDDQQQQLVEQFAAMESALSSTQSESTWLTQQLNSLTGS